MKTSFISFCKKISYAARLAIQKELEYPANYFADALLNPLFSSIVEMALWFGFFKYSSSNQIGNQPLEAYLSYALWSGFISRLTANWMYESLMTYEIETGRVNSILTRPISFYEYYLGQYIGYRIATSWIAFLLPICIYFFYPGTVDLSKLPLVFVIFCVYVVFAHTLSFCVASLAFFMTRTQSITFLKNITLMLFTGELFPLDLFPEGIRNIMIHLPFANAVFIPIGYLTGRIDLSMALQGLQTLVVSLFFLLIIAHFIWNQGRKVYSGTGA